jgi:hypothetical protein
MIRTALFAALALVLAALPCHGAEPALGLITIVDGDAVVVREAREFAAAEGQALRAEDIVRSRDGTRLARIELDGGTLLDLGPATELLLQPRAFAAPAEQGTSLYLLRGWLKVTTSAAKGAPGVALASPQVGVARLVGSAVVHVAPQAVLVFLETGHADVLDRTAGKPGAVHALSDGDAFAVGAGMPGALLRRPPPDLLEGLPRAFADSLPHRAALWHGRAVEPGPLATLRYADLAPWLHAEPALRESFVKRFSPLAREPAFRAGLVAQVRAHPEWGRVLFPERYRPKPAALTRRSAPPAPAPAASGAEAALAQAPRSETP